MNSAECKAEFRVEKQELPRLVAALQLPPVLRCEQRSICEDMDGAMYASQNSCPPMQAE